MPVYVTHLFGKNLKGAALPKEWVRAHLCSNDCDYFFSPVTYIKYICKDIVFPGTIAFMVFYLHTNMPKGTTSHTDKILVFSVITWGKHDYPHLQTRILNSNTCSFFLPTASLLMWCRGGIQSHSFAVISNKILWLSKTCICIQDKPKHNVWLMLNHLSSSLALWLYSIYKTPCPVRQILALLCFDLVHWVPLLKSLALQMVIIWV